MLEWNEINSNAQFATTKVENYTIKKNIIFLKKGVDENVLHVSKQQNEIEKLQANLESLKTLFETLKKSVLEKEKRINEKVCEVCQVREDFVVIVVIM